MARFRSVFAVLGVCALSGVLAIACMNSGRHRPVRDLALQADIARGGRLYDKWYAVVGQELPRTSHPAYPGDGQYATKPGANWRCKECHGWDYLGRDGAYASGEHSTGIPGVAALRGAASETVLAALVDETHGFGDVLGAEDLRQLALFVARGQVNTDAVIDRASKKVRGDAGRGATYYAALCVGCHGAEGKAEDMPVLGDLTRSNPWEALHKVLNGQPGAEMPALRVLDRQIALDVLAFAQTLPGE